MALAEQDRRTRDAYDAVAADYARLLPDLSAETPLDLAVLDAFAAAARAGDGGPVADVGCGSGRVAAHLADAGLAVLGLDLSAGMLQQARAARPDLPWAVAHAGALPLRDASLAGLLAWYSLINLRTELLPAVCAGFGRVLRPGAPVLLAFQSGGGEQVDRPTSYGHPVPLTYHRHAVEDVVQALTSSGLVLHTSVVREPSQAHETTAQALLLARRAG